jgi:hypothetical protein
LKQKSSFDQLSRHLQESTMHLNPTLQHNLQTFFPTSLQTSSPRMFQFLIKNNSSSSNIIRPLMIQSIIMTKKTLLPLPESTQIKKRAMRGRALQNFINWSICLARQLPLVG